MTEQEFLDMFEGSQEWDQAWEFTQVIRTSEELVAEAARIRRERQAARREALEELDYYSDEE